jgi:hypothetical protein
MLQKCSILKKNTATNANKLQKLRRKKNALTTKSQYAYFSIPKNVKFSTLIIFCEALHIF